MGFHEQPPGPEVPPPLQQPETKPPQEVPPINRHEEVATPQEGPLVERPQEAIEKKRFHETVNGIEISVGWDESYGDYTIYFPQVEISSEKDIFDQVVRISESDAEAESVFNKARELAAGSATPTELYLKMERFIRREIHRQ